MKLLQRYDRLGEFLCAPESGTTLACMRIAMALIVVHTMLGHVWTGTADFIWAPLGSGGYRILAENKWLSALGGGQLPTMRALLAVCVCSASALALGWGGRVPALLCVISYRTLVWSNPDVTTGADRLLVNGLWLLFLTPSTTTWSIDCRLREGRWTSARQVGAWGRYLFILQLVILYTLAGWQKLGTVWLPMGQWSALHWALMNPGRQKMQMAWATDFFILTQVGTASVWLWETSTPIIVFIKWLRRVHDKPGRFERLRALSRWIDLRLIWLIPATFMHVGIYVFLEVGNFSWIAMCYWFSLFRPAELEHFFGRWFALALFRKGGRAV